MEGRIGTGSTLRISDNYSSSSAAVEVSPMWNSNQEEIQFQIILLDHKDEDSDSGIKLQWDGLRLMLGDRTLYPIPNEAPADEQDRVACEHTSTSTYLMGASEYSVSCDDCGQVMDE